MNKEKSTSGFFQLFPPFSALGKILTTELLLHPESCPPPIRRRWGKGLDKSCFMFVSRCGLIFFLILCVHCWCSLGGFRSGKNCNRMKDLKGRVTQILSLCIQIIDNTRLKEVLDIQSHKYSIKYIVICFRKEEVVSTGMYEKGSCRIILFLYYILSIWLWMSRENLSIL